MPDHGSSLRRIPRSDLVVIGGGTAGAAAAVACARRGHRVLLVEEANCLGGVSTSGGIGEWFANLDGLGDIFDRLRTELGRYGPSGSRFFNPEYLKIVWQRLADEAGVHVLYHATLAQANVAARRLRAAIVVACSQTIRAEADWFIDASGEGDLAALAGAAYMQGDPQRGRTLHMSLGFTLADSGQPVTPYLPAGLSPINSPDDVPGLRTNHPLPDGRVYCNMTKIVEHDPTDPSALSAAEGEARRQLARLVHYLQRVRYPRHVLVSSGARIGIREGRRIIGDYVLSEDDIAGEAPRRVFPDGVAVATSQIDFHSLSRAGDGGWRQGVEPYNIPFRCLTARDLDNLLMAGKCISGDQVAHSSYRMTPTCCAMGQAAGTAAAIAIEGRAANIRDVNVQRLRGELAAAGMELDPFRHRAFAPDKTGDRTSTE